MSLKWNFRTMKDVSFMNLMTHRIYNILIIANPYDAFVLEDDGRIEERLFNEYMDLRLRYPPIFTQVSTIAEAAQVLATSKIDLAICMPSSAANIGSPDNDAFCVAREVKRLSPSVPCVVLTPFSHGITQRIQSEDMTIFEYVFCWLGNTNLILSIIKLIEDKMNLSHDTREAGVQIILLVEDSIRYYSSILPNLYQYVLLQTKHFSTEALNVQAATLRMRGRPKIVLARTYAEAQTIFDNYHDNILGVISDAQFPLVEGGEKCSDAGLRLLRYMRSIEEYMPLVMESKESSNRAKATAEGFQFVDKNSKILNLDLRDILAEHFGFGDFIFRDPVTKTPVARVATLKELQDTILSVPASSLMYHVSRNHTSRWLSARALFPISEFLKRITWHELKDVEKHREIIHDAILYYRKIKNTGTVAVFDRAKFDQYAHFARIGDGSLGGKGRGLAFLDYIIKQHPALAELHNVTIQIPKTLVICTDVFDEYMEKNNLYAIALSDTADDTILHAFLSAQLPDSFIADFHTFIDATQVPLAIRSSSLLEDSHYQPFAGIYSTYMIPYLDNREMMIHMLAAAIKSVYASVFYKASKAYMTATQNVIDQEKMAVIVQQVVGKDYGTTYYPLFSGVLRSINAYPIGHEKPEEGIAALALGLGKYVVDGGQTLRVSPAHTNHILQLSDTTTALTQTQTTFYALDTTRVGTDFEVDDGFNLLALPVSRAYKDGSLDYIASTYSAEDAMLYDGVYPRGRKVITFAGLLKSRTIPFAQVLQTALQLGQDAMRRPVEIELAGNVLADGTAEIYLLQIRPIADAQQQVNIDIDSIPNDSCLVKTNEALGHGIIDDIRDIVVVNTDHYSPADNSVIVQEIDTLNRQLAADNAHYLLIGPGRWGSTDPWLGIPVKWNNISHARVIVEQQPPHRHVDPSQGTHFFQNITSLNIGYLTINNNPQSFINNDLLRSLPPAPATSAATSATTSTTTSATISATTSATTSTTISATISATTSATTSATISATTTTPHLTHFRLTRPLTVLISANTQQAAITLNA